MKPTIHKNKVRSFRVNAIRYRFSTTNWEINELKTANQRSGATTRDCPIVPRK
ncbi:hypothetical protein THIOM_004319 [Candidatus Thiomargarita nelsonii]|uniref:Uncharacterized protein n=1 Tax=Candidatus Thiomargarita nelsonii TaxID=1003181 RepID=A0A176RW67_9GAMM|nr:hypothetical protein THIOM_004319 [Candidatus Thiomargarita nelsonii]